MAARRRYSDREKAEALAALEANSGNIERTSRELGIPATTLHDWRDGKGLSDDVSELRGQKKADLADNLTDIAWLLAGDLRDDAKRRKSGLAQTATAMAIVIDKAQLLRGEPTDITDVRSLSDDEKADRYNELVDLARARRDRAAGGDDDAALREVAEDG